MCGIAGIARYDSGPVSFEKLRAMCDVMHHRGPDDAGYYLGNGVALGMRRLSIIDLAQGHPPVHNEDGSVQVVLNGEIYNFRELRRSLENLGHRFHTATDTETIAHLYEEYGVDCIARLRGMFALALWDEKRKLLLLARDRLGIKPLYYVEYDGGLAFASELKALLQLPELECTLNWQSVNYLFTFLCTPPAESIVAGVHKLKPGQRLVAVVGHAPVITQYWDVKFQPVEGRSEAEIAEQLRALLEESVRLHLVSDVPVGAFLSGGLDSSAVVATMARLSHKPVKTFSIGFREPQYDETAYARRVAAAFGTDHQELILEPDIVGLLDDIAWYLDEPFGDSSAIPTYMVSKLAAQQVTVALSGDGGDELFAGYDKYRVEARERNYRHIPAPIRQLLGRIGERMPEGRKGRNFLRHLSLDGAERYLDAGTLFKSDQKQKLFQPEVMPLLQEDSPLRALAMRQSRFDGHWLSVLQQLDLTHYLPLDILTKVDRMSMAHSLEVRVPLLDHVLVEFVAGIPPELQFNGGITKSLFKRAMRGLLPDDIIDRPKHGFAVPLGSWFRGQLESTVRELLLCERSRQRGIFNARYLEQLLRLHAQGRPLDLRLWTLISFELWCRTFLDGAKPRLPARLPEAHRHEAAAHYGSAVAALPHAG
ncbi:MAG TPA: asparagine synthase (glutamine-hydrolyzing) [Gammaproteobacteria bacterium]|nr:asparagine synthase (glutamine-hydrolyzing) [Gammaproteobacteria bacterium]